MVNKVEVVEIKPTIDNRIHGNQQKMLRVASYSRVSTNFEEQLLSFESQKRYYTDLILRTNGWILAGTYADEGISGTTESRRPDFLRLMRNCERGKIDLIVTKSISRFSRDIEVTIRRVRKLKELGVGILFEKEGINTLDDNVEFALLIHASIAQEESNNLSQNVRKGKQMAMKRGEHSWNYSQIAGYEKGEDGKPRIIEAEAEIIRRIFRDYIKGDSEKLIADKLNEEQMPTLLKSEKWQKSYVGRILQNERYCGDVLLQKTFIENHRTKKVKKNNGELPKYLIKNNHPAIVSREVFERANYERTMRSSKKKVSQKALTEQGKHSSRYALTGKLYCQCCGLQLRRQVWTKKTSDSLLKEKQSVWRCINRIDYGKKYCHESITVDEVSLHDAIMKAINKTESDRSEIIQYVSRDADKKLFEATNAEFDIELAMSRISQITNHITEMMTGSGLAENLSLITTLNDEAVQINKKIEQHKIKVQGMDLGKALSEVGEYLGQKQVNYDEYNDELVRQIVHSIRIINENIIKIIFMDGTEMDQPIKLKVKSHKIKK